MAAWIRRLRRVRAPRGNERDTERRRERDEAIERGRIIYEHSDDWETVPRGDTRQATISEHEALAESLRENADVLAEDGDHRSARFNLIRPKASRPFD